MIIPDLAACLCTLANSTRGTLSLRRTSNSAPCPIGGNCPLSPIRRSLLPGSIALSISKNKVLLFIEASSMITRSSSSGSLAFFKNPPLGDHCNILCIVDELLSPFWISTIAALPDNAPAI